MDMTLLINWLTRGVFITILAFLSDKYGRKPIMIFGHFFILIGNYLVYKISLIIGEK